MNLQWLGHSCFRLVESTGTVIITDPYDKSLVGYELPRFNADVVTSSHNHEDHNNLKGVDGSPMYINRAGFFDIMGVQITSIPSYHDNIQGKKRGQNLIFKFRLDGIDVCHMGDIGEDCSAIITDKILPVNILLIPIGGLYTINPEQAKEYISILMPEIVIPMHYKTSDSLNNIEKLDAFTKLFDESQITYSETSVMEFERDDFTGEPTKIIIARRANT